MSALSACAFSVPAYLSHLDVSYLHCTELHCICKGWQEAAGVKVQVEAMSLLEQTAARDDLRMDYNLQPGDMQFINNHTILHARSAFKDWEDEKDGGKRHLLRTWISPSNGRSASITHTHTCFPAVGCPWLL